MLLHHNQQGFATVRCEHIYLLQKGKHAEPNAAPHQADAHLQRVKVYESSKWGVLKNKHAVRLADHGDYQDVRIQSGACVYTEDMCMCVEMCGCGDVWMCV